ncbi:hypothetical protein [Microbacterium sp. KR10-403]|uniref:hypothetical protein n=1 Tax=Microbacterium sp. KR10-403 TaxID=3158581 RepID=UPI0032E4263A
MTCTVARSLVVAVAVGACMSIAACAPTPSFEDDVAAARATHPVAQAPSAAPSVATPAPDPSGDAWVDYFDIDDGGIVGGARSSNAGSFGPPGQTYTVSNADLTVLAGHHTVEISCAGAPVVTVTLAPVSDVDDTAMASEPASTTDIDCPVSALLEVTLANPGLFVTLDSHGEPGGFLVRIDPGSVLQAP